MGETPAHPVIVAPASTKLLCGRSAVLKSNGSAVGVLMHRRSATYLASILFAVFVASPNPFASSERGVSTLPQFSRTSSCNVTVAPDRPLTIPAPYPASAPSKNFWHGSERLWTMLGAEGTWAGLPRNEKGFRQKVFWWYLGFDGRVERQPDLSVTGRRLDGPESFTHRTATNAHHVDFGGWTILTGIDIPTEGCWELTGEYRGQSVTFVILITA